MGRRSGWWRSSATRVCTPPSVCWLGLPELGEALVPASMARLPPHTMRRSSSQGCGRDGRDGYLSSLALPVMEARPEEQRQAHTDLAALTELPPTWASSAPALLPRQEPPPSRLHRSRILRCPTAGSDTIYRRVCFLRRMYCHRHGCSISCASSIHSGPLQPFLPQVQASSPSPPIRHTNIVDLAAPAPLPPFTDHELRKGRPLALLCTLPPPVATAPPLAAPRPPQKVVPHQLIHRTHL